MVMGLPATVTGLEGAVVTGATTAEKITFVEREVIVADLDQGPPPNALPASVANCRLASNVPSSGDVRAMLVVLEAHALTARPLRAAADADLVQLAGIGARGDDVATAALVAGEYLVAVKLEEP